MPFRSRQKLNSPVSSCICVDDFKTDSQGFVKNSRKDSHVALPDRDLFDLSALLRAGVPLKEVNPHMIDSGSVDLGSVSRKPVKVSSEPVPPSDPEPVPSSDPSTNPTKE